MSDQKTIEELLTPIEIYAPQKKAPLCPNCFTTLIEDWSQDIDEDGEFYEYEIYSCEACGFQTLI